MRASGTRRAICRPGRLQPQHELRRGLRGVPLRWGLPRGADVGGLAAARGSFLHRGGRHLEALCLERALELDPTHAVARRGEPAVLRGGAWHFGCSTTDSATHATTPRSGEPSAPSPPAERKRRRGAGPTVVTSERARAFCRRRRGRARRRSSPWRAAASCDVARGHRPCSA